MDDPTNPNAPDSMMAWARQRMPASKVTSRASSRASTLESGFVEGTAKHPFPVADREAYLAATKSYGIAKRSLTAPVGRVRLSELQGIQETINRERLSQHMQNPKLVPDGSRAAGNGMLVDLPIVVKHAGTFYVHDGHHRLTAAHLRGETEARVRLVDLDVPADPT